MGNTLMALFHCRVVGVYFVGGKTAYMATTFLYSFRCWTISESRSIPFSETILPTRKNQKKKKKHIKNNDLELLLIQMNEFSNFSKLQFITIQTLQEGCSETVFRVEKNDLVVKLMMSHTWQQLCHKLGFNLAWWKSQKRHRELWNGNIKQ